MTLFHLGIDSTDSATLGMCTTYLGARLLAALAGRGIEVAGPAALVRLNPNVPWKTRGNGAVRIRCRAPAGRAGEIVAAARALIEELAVMEDPQTNPGLAVLEGEVPEGLAALYRRALHRIIDIEDAAAIGRAAGALVHGWKDGRGIIGALAAIGADLERERTWEVLAYRTSERCGSRRRVDAASVRAASERHPSTFFNVDDGGELHCVPSSPCPVLFGIRGTDPEDTLAAAAEIDAEPIERWALWLTNQHTDAHIERVDDVSGAEPYRSINLDGVVATAPALRRGGHLYFTLRDGSSGEIACAAYRQTRSFREQLGRLVPGDSISVWGAVRPAAGGHARVINLEKVRLDAPASVWSFANPSCPRCGARMESMGSGQGKRCRKCRLRIRSARKDRTVEARALVPGFIEPPPDAWRHLYRPCGRPPLTTVDPGGPWWGEGRPIGPIEPRARGESAR